MAQRSASAQQILEIRRQADAGTLNPKAWADVLRCSLETVRRYARRDTARELDWEQRPEDYGTAQGVEPSDREVAASLQRLQLLAAQAAAKPSVDSLLDELTAKGKNDDNSGK